MDLCDPDAAMSAGHEVSLNPSPNPNPYPYPYPYPYP